jgi:hypothetical protein
MVGKRITALQARLRTLTGVALLGGCALASLAHGKPDEEKPEAPSPPERKQQDALLQLIRTLTPEQKSKLMESIKTWQQLGPELKTALRARDKAIRKTLNDEVQAALEGSTFSKEQRELFEKRYREERRKLEASLRTEFEARRKAALEEMVNSLKKSVAEGDAQ